MKMPKILTNATLILLFIFLLILGLSLTIKYQQTSSPYSSPTTTKLKPTPTLAFKENVINIGKYQVTLPAGWKSQPIQYSVIAPWTEGEDVCRVSPRFDEANNSDYRNNPACKYTYIQQRSNENNTFLIADTRQVPLGGGGYIPTVEDTILLGPTGYQTGFLFVWEGTYKDSEKPQAGTTYLPGEDGKPQLYYAVGCLKKDLCISFDPLNPRDPRAGGWQDVEEFKKFVNSLKIEELPMP